MSKIRLSAKADCASGLSWPRGRCVVAKRDLLPPKTLELRAVQTFCVTSTRRHVFAESGAFRFHSFALRPFGHTVATERSTLFEKVDRRSYCNCAARPFLIRTCRRAGSVIRVSSVRFRRNQTSAPPRQGLSTENTLRGAARICQLSAGNSSFFPGMGTGCPKRDTWLRRSLPIPGRLPSITKA